jgi:membrane associated rhomboid family serine protease
MSERLPRPVTTPKPGRPPRPAEPMSWGSAFLVMLVATGVLWAVELADALDRHRLDQYGLRPRTLQGLEGIVTMPLLHANAGHLLSNTAPFVLLGWVLMLSGLRSWLVVTGLVMLAGGFATWLVAPSGVIIGASGLIFGWLGYLLARAFFARRILWIIVAALVVLFFGSLLSGLLPSFDSNISWQAHVCGFAAGIGTAWLLHPRGLVGRRPRGPLAS